MEKKIKVYVAVRSFSEGDEIRVFDTREEVFGLQDYIDEDYSSEKTYNKLKTGDYYPKRYGSTIRAYC